MLLFSNRGIPQTGASRLPKSKIPSFHSIRLASLQTLLHELDLPCQWPVNAYYTQQHGAKETNTTLTAFLVSEKPLRKSWKDEVGGEVWEREEGARSKTVWGMGHEGDGWEDGLREAQLARWR